SLCTEPTTSAIYTLSLHDALPISAPSGPRHGRGQWLAGGRSRGLDRHPPDANRRAGDGARTELVAGRTARALWIVAGGTGATLRDRKSTRLNSSHDQNSYAVLCLK